MGVRLRENTMLLTKTETHFIPESHPFYRWAVEECGKAATLYNYVNYLKRQAFTGKHEQIPAYADLVKQGKYLSAFDIITRMRKLREPLYRAMLKSAEAGQVVLKVEQAWRSWHRALQVYRRRPAVFNGCPRMPKYLPKRENGGLYMLIFGANDAALKQDGSIHLNRRLKLPIKTTLSAFRQVHIVPVVGGVNICLIYTEEVSPPRPDATGAIGVDVGINNLMAITSNVEPISLLANGRPLKSMNSYFNRKAARLRAQLEQQKLKSSKRLRRLQRKRKHKLRDYLHKASRRVVALMQAHNIGSCYIGRLKRGTKRERGAPGFCGIPLGILVDMLRYKIAEAGGRLVEVDEGYTSLCSFPDAEPVAAHSCYMGRRLTRGLFVSAGGRAINADINASLNILRKGSGQAVTDCDALYHPTQIDIEMKQPSGRAVGCTGPVLGPLSSLQEGIKPATSAGCSI